MFKISIFIKLIQIRPAGKLRLVDNFPGPFRSELNEPKDLDKLVRDLRSKILLHPKVEQNVVRKYKIFDILDNKLIYCKIDIGKVRKIYVVET